MVDASSAADLPDPPRLRRLEVQRLVQDGRRGILVWDPLAVAAGACFVPDALVPLVARFDGRRSIADIESDLRARGHEVPAGLVAGLARQLDEAFLLDSPRGRSAEAHACATFLGDASGARPARHAGTAGYPREPAALRRALETLLPPRAAASRSPARGLIAPHIDLLRGAEGYRAAYDHLRACPPADLYVIFGTGHKGPERVVTGLPLDWETPLGRVPTDRAFVDAVHARIGGALPCDTLMHRDEHSIEFQVLLLAHAVRGHAFAVAGFLCGELPASAAAPEDDPRVAEIVAAFRDVAKTSGRRVCWIAGADLAHVGPRFGPEAHVDADRLARLARDDHDRLAHLRAGAPGAFHRAVVSDGNRDRVCSATAMFLCSALAGGRGELLHYGQAAAPDGSQVVTYCGMAFSD